MCGIYQTENVNYLSLLLLIFQVTLNILYKNSNKSLKRVVLNGWTIWTSIMSRQKIKGETGHKLDVAYLCLLVVQRKKNC